MSRYIDRDELKKKMRENYIDYIYDDDIDFIDEIPTADVAEVVRCKDCKWFTYHKWKECSWCRKLHIPWVGEDFFCKDGERRENGQ